MTREVVLLAISASPVCFCSERLRTFIFPSCLAPGASAVAGRHSGSAQTNRDELPSHYRIGRRVSFRQLPSCAQPCSLEWSCRQSAFARAVSASVRTDRPPRARYRRYHRAPTWQADPSQGYLPRSGAQLAFPLRESQRLTLGEFDALSSTLAISANESLVWRQTWEVVLFVFFAAFVCFCVQCVCSVVF
jgi:hypothetical protein